MAIVQSYDLCGYPERFCVLELTRERGELVQKLSSVQVKYARV